MVARGTADDVDGPSRTGHAAPGRATASHPPHRHQRTDIKGSRTGDDCRNPIRNNRTSRACGVRSSVDCRGPDGLDVTFDTAPIKPDRRARARARNERKWAPGYRYSIITVSITGLASVLVRHAARSNWTMVFVGGGRGG